jgi:hypothetical protein
LIDGFDEYDGEEADNIPVLQKLMAIPGIKVYASSRPWNAFKNTFQKPTSTLVVEEITIDDIRAYIDSQLLDTNAFQSLV